MPTQAQSIARVQYLVTAHVAGIAQVAIAEAEAYLASVRLDETSTERASFMQRLRQEGPATPAMADVMKALEAP